MLLGEARVNEAGRGVTCPTAAEHTLPMYTSCDGGRGSGGERVAATALDERARGGSQ
jgi:hypothetical protein